MRNAIRDTVILFGQAAVCIACYGLISVIWLLPWAFVIYVLFLLAVHQ